MMLAVVWPAFADPPRDSFPLSNYPMFTFDRSTEASFSTVVVMSDGEPRTLSPRVIGGTDQVVQAAASVRQAINGDTTDALCREVAARLDQRGTVEVVTETFDTRAWFDGDETPIEREVHARCAAS